MLYKHEIKHVRKRLPDGTTIPFSLFSTRTGWFSTNHKQREEDISEDLGISIPIYFKLLKQLLILFALLTVLSFPNFWLYYHNQGEPHVFGLHLGSFGQSTLRCHSKELRFDSDEKIYCPIGSSFGALQHYTIKEVVDIDAVECKGGKDSNYFPTKESEALYDTHCDLIDNPFI